MKKKTILTNIKLFMSDISTCTCPKVNYYVSRNLRKARENENSCGNTIVNNINKQTSGEMRSYVRKGCC